MRYMLDTDTCIYWLNGVKSINDKMSEVDPDLLGVSIITIAELLYGAYNSANIENNLAKAKEFEDAINVFSIDKNCVKFYAKIKAKLRKEGQILDDFDILIAVTALNNDAILVTNNIKHFERIDELRLENWKT